MIKKLLNIALAYRQLYLNCRKDKGADTKTIVDVPKFYGTLSYKAVYNILRGVCSGRLYLSDETYKVTTVDEIKRFLDKDKTDHYKYTRTLFDCDDFAYRLMGDFSSPGWASLAFGIAWTKSHAYNLFINVDREVYAIEPQSDAIFKIREGGEMYYPPRIIMM